MNTSSSGFRADIQGLRALAVIAVILFHYDSSILPGGFIGVDIFLVISGYLITLLLVKQKERSGYSLAETLKYFYFGRIRRIMPAYFFMLLVVAVFAGFFLIENDISSFKESLTSAVLFNSNNFFATFGDYFAPSVSEQPLLHTWSLAVEMQFYLLAPILILLLSRRHLFYLTILLIVILTLYAEYMLRVEEDGKVTYFSLAARIPEFLIGSLLALGGDKYFKGWFLGFLGLSVVFVSFWFVDGSMAFPGLLAVLPSFGIALVISGRPDSKLGGILSSRILVWIGALSYSLYLWHWPVLAFLRYYSQTEDLDAVLTLVFIVVTFLLSCFSFYFVEKPLRISWEKRKSSFLAFLGLTAVACSSIFFVGTLNASIGSGPLGLEYSRYADRNEICHGKIVGDCLVGDLSSSNKILVLGDSHAAMLNTFFNVLGSANGFSAMILSGSGCVALPGFDYERLPSWAKQPCRNQIAEAEKNLENYDTVFVGGYWSGHNKYSDFKVTLENFFANNPSKRIFVLSQVPKLSKNPLRVNRFAEFGIPSKVIPDKIYQVANKEIMSLTERYEGVFFLDLSNLPLFSNIPLYEGEMIYFDEHHLNEVGASIYAAQSMPKFNTALKY